MSILIINHCDLDAIGCKVVLDFYNFHYDKMLSVNYGDINEDTQEIYNYDTIICTDFSLPTSLVEKLLSLGKRVEIYDHHDYTNDDSTCGLISLKHENFKLVHDLTRCGTAIVADSFKPKKVRLQKCFYDFVDLVNTYDLYQQGSPLWEEAENCNRVLWGCATWSLDGIEKFNFICSYWLNKINKNDEWFWSDFEKQKIKRAVEIENEEYEKALLTYKTHIDSKGNKYGVAVASKKISTIASRLLKEKSDILYLIMFNTYGNKWGKLSLRSTEKSNFDCTQFEECHGHKEASGGEVDEDTAKKLYNGKQFLKYKL